jgi:hypothetical protein
LCSSLSKALFRHLDATSLSNVPQLEEGEVRVRGDAEKLLDQIFSTVNFKLQKLCNLQVAEIDGMELLGILAVVQQYMTDHLTPKPQIENNKEINTKSEEPSAFLTTMLQELRISLLSKLKTYMADQIAWILIQKGDPKKAGVLVPVAKFPSFVRQVLEMTGGQVREWAAVCVLVLFAFFQSHKVIIDSVSRHTNIQRNQCSGENAISNDDSDIIHHLTTTHTHTRTHTHANTHSAH